MSTDTTKPAVDRGFMFFEDGSIDEIAGEGETYRWTPSPAMFTELVTAGYPVDRASGAPDAERFVDVSTDELGLVTAYTSNPAREYNMGEASAVVARWLAST
jgi:hypothetical protein